MTQIIEKFLKIHCKRVNRKNNLLKITLKIHNLKILIEMRIIAFYQTKVIVKIAHKLTSYHLTRIKNIKLTKK
jgi:hypothetical protein